VNPQNTSHPCQAEINSPQERNFAKLLLKLLAKSAGTTRNQRLPVLELSRRSAGAIFCLASMTSVVARLHFPSDYPSRELIGLVLKSDLAFQRENGPG
jgi:hypothetical protein